MDPAVETAVDLVNDGGADDRMQFGVNTGRRGYADDEANHQNNERFTRSQPYPIVDQLLLPKLRTRVRFPSSALM